MGTVDRVEHETRMPGDAQPLLPAPQEGDPEDVAWALSTAEALWNRGEYADAVAWVRRAVTAASEAEADLRVVQLAKAAAELSALVDSFGPTPPSDEKTNGEKASAEGASEDGANPESVDDALDLEVEVEPADVPSAAPARTAPARPPGPPPRGPRVPTPNPVPSPLLAVPVASVAAVDAMVDSVEVPPPPSPPSPPPSAEDDSLGAIPTVPPSPPDFPPTPRSIRAAPPSAPPEAVSPDEVSREEVPREEVSHEEGTPSLAEAAVGLRSVEPEAHRPSVEAEAPRPSPSRAQRKSVVPPPGPPAEPLELDGLPPPEASPPRASRVVAPLVGSVPSATAPRVSLAQAPSPKLSSPKLDDGVQSRVSDAPPRTAIASSTQVPAPPRVPSVGVPVAPPIASSVAAPSSPVKAPALETGPVSGRAVLLDPDRFEVLADVPDDAREALVRAAEKIALLPDETAPAPAMVIVLRGELEVRAHGFVTHLDTIGAEQVRLLAPLAPAEGELEVVASSKGARFLAVGREAVEALRTAAPWVVQELEPASDDVHVVAGALRGRLGPKLDGGILDAVLARAKTMRLPASATVVKEGEPVRALILVGAGILEVRAGAAPDAPEIATVEPGEVLFPSELLSRAPAPSTVRAGPNGALVIVATRGATEELLVTVPPLLEILGEE